jgi:UDP-3-O-[3-hydroxymyristoyl] glucosamine N-acyltransferase
VVVGQDCLIHSAVQVREGCRLGDRVIVQNGAVVGGDGFGFARRSDGAYEKIPQVGIVVIEDDVEIGALVAIDRASMGETRVGRGTKIDNLVQVGHSVRIGRHRDRGPGGHRGQHEDRQQGDPGRPGGVAGHITVGDGAIATAQTGIPGSVEPGAVVSGYPAIDEPRVAQGQRGVRQAARDAAPPSRAGTAAGRS